MSSYLSGYNDTKSLYPDAPIFQKLQIDSDDDNDGMTDVYEIGRALANVGELKRKT